MFDELEDDLYDFTFRYFDPSIGDWVTLRLHEFPDPMLATIPCVDENPE